MKAVMVLNNARTCVRHVDSDLQEAQWKVETGLEDLVSLGVTNNISLPFASSRSKKSLVRLYIGYNQKGVRSSVVVLL